MKVQCANPGCGKSIQISPYQLKRSRTGLFYCSHDCCGEARRNRVIVQCFQCGANTVKLISKVRERNYCSRKCQGEAHRNRMAVHCETCGVELVRISSAVKELNYCPEHNPSKRNKVVVQCDQCHKSFEQSPWQLKRSQRHYCSHRCFYRAGHSQATRAKLSIAASKRLAETKNAPSAIEFTMVEHLKRWGFREGIDFITQKHFDSSEDYPEGSFGMNCDFYFPAFKLVVEMNGGFYHSDPALYPDREALYGIQRRHLARYERKVRWLHSQSIRLIEVWERENEFAEQAVIAPLLLLTVCQAVAEERIPPA